jgi:tRNA(Arg) A34 adenosine deaminase TadA
MDSLELRFRLPGWVKGLIGEGKIVCVSVEERMWFAIRLSQQNVRHKTGGPFGAAVFGGDGRLVAAGVNMVETSKCSVLHAEIVALALAQKVLGRYDIGDGGRERYELVSTTEPCAMCLGAVHWSGVSSLVCGARDEDARGIGFDEGPKPADWIGALESRGIVVMRDVLRREATNVLREYAEGGGTIYNASRDGTSGSGQ